MRNLIAEHNRLQSRRQFLKTAAAAVSAPYVITSTALGADGRPVLRSGGNRSEVVTAASAPLADDSFRSPYRLAGDGQDQVTRLQPGSARGTVGRDGPGRRNVVGRHRIAQRHEHACIANRLDGPRLCR